MAGKRRRLYAIVAVIVIIVVSTAFFIYYWQSHSNLVRIKDFFKSGGGQAGEYLILGFTVKMENQGVNDVTGLIMVVKVLGNGTELAQDGHPLRPNTLFRGEEREDEELGVIINMTETIDETLSAVAWIELNGAILDQANLSLQQPFFS